MRTLLSRAGLAVSLCASLFLAPPASALQQDEVVDKVIELGRSEPQVMEHLRYLSERIGHRLTGSSDIERASEWARAQFASYGLDARLEKWGEFPVGFDRGPSSGGMVSPVHVDFVFTTYAWSAGTPGPVRGPAVVYPGSLDALAENKDRLAGAWVVMPPRGEMPDREVRAEIDAALDELGIAGRISNAGSRVRTGGNSRISYDDLPTAVTVRVRQEFYNDVRARLERGEDVELEFDIDNRFLPGPMPQYNVIADLVGSELPDEYVVVGGHLDSWDGAQGAQDNGTGVATTMEAARLLALAGAKPKRTIRFMLWGGEEQGLLGSRGYVRDHPEEMDRISAVLVHDMGTNYLSGIAGPKALVGQLREAMAPIMELDSAMPFTIREVEGLSRGGGSDHAAFVAAGVPGFFWNQSGRANYGLIHHTERDNLDLVVPEYQRHSAMVVALGAYGIANLDEKLDRTNLIREGGGSRRRDPTRRYMGISLDGTKVQGVMDGGMAAAAKWKAGDVILSVDGVKVTTRGAVSAELQKGGPKKVFQLRRGEATVESVLDYTGTDSEKAREAKRKKEEADKKAEKESAGG